MHVLRNQWGARSISQVDAAVLQEAVDREPFQQIEAIASRSRSPTSATKSATGDVIVVRYADDMIVGFEHQHEAEQFLADLKARLARFGLTLHPDKTRLIEFGRSAIANWQARGLGKPEVVRLPGVHAFLRDPSKRLGLCAREETGGQANACQTSRDQGAAHGHTPRRGRKAGPLALSGSARLDGLLCRTDERFGDLSIPASHNRTLAPCPHASKPTTPINVDANEEDR